MQRRRRISGGAVRGSPKRSRPWRCARRPVVLRVVGLGPISMAHGPLSVSKNDPCDMGAPGDAVRQWPLTPRRPTRCQARPYRSEIVCGMPRRRSPDRFRSHSDVPPRDTAATAGSWCARARAVRRRDGQPPTIPYRAASPACQAAVGRPAWRPVPAGAEGWGMTATGVDDGSTARRRASRKAVRPSQWMAASLVVLAAGAAVVLFFMAEVCDQLASFT